jgi:hypothetical protein
VLGPVRQVTVEDRLVLEGMRVPYNHTIEGNSHIKVDRATVQLRKIYAEILDGTWSGLTGAGAYGFGGCPIGRRSGSG